jgi:hypothetical protein
MRRSYFGGRVSYIQKVFKSVRELPGILMCLFSASSDLHNYTMKRG